jgi:hypothetical protein
MMNDQKIYEHIAREPGIRAVRLADLLDLDLEDVNAALAALVGIGDVVTKDGFSPAGTPCKLYTLSDKFKSSVQGQVAVAKAEVANDGDLTLSKVDRAIAYITKHGTATSAQLHAVMGLTPEQYPSTFLSHVIASGKLKKDGKDWTMGDGKPAAPPRIPSYGRSAQQHDTRKAQFDANTPAEMPDGSLHVPVFKDTKPKELPRKPAGKRAAAPVTREEVVDLPAAAISSVDRAVNAPRFGRRLDLPGSTHYPTAAPTAAPAAATVPKQQPTPPVFRAGLWSDGTIELQRNGQTVAILHEDEAQYLTEFLEKAKMPLIKVAA